MESYFDGEVVYFDIGLVPSLNIQTVEKAPGIYLDYSDGKLFGVEIRRPIELSELSFLNESVIDFIKKAIPLGMVK